MKAKRNQGISCYAKGREQGKRRRSPRIRGLKRRPIKGLNGEKKRKDARRRAMSSTQNVNVGDPSEANVKPHWRKDERASSRNFGKN